MKSIIFGFAVGCTLIALWHLFQPTIVAMDDEPQAATFDEHFGKWPGIK
jgi:hypothetical protein